MFFNCLEGGR